MEKNELVPIEEQNDIIIYHSKDGKVNVALMTRDGNVWLSQQQMATLFATSVPNVSMHIAKILKEEELDENSVIKYFLTTAADGKSYGYDKNIWLSAKRRRGRRPQGKPMPPKEKRFKP